MSTDSPLLTADEDAFVPLPGGALCFGVICDERAKACGCKAGEIRLQYGNTAWGGRHILEKHADGLGEKGYKIITDFVLDAGTNHTVIYEDREGRLRLFLPGYAAQMGGKTRYDFVLSIQWKDGFWSVVTGYELRAQKRIKSKVLWKRSEPAIDGH